MKTILFSLAMIFASIANAQTGISSVSASHGWRNPDDPVVWQGEVSRGNKPAVAAKIERLPDMGYRITADGQTFEFPFASKIDSRECPVVVVDGKEFTITAFRIKGGTELHLRVDYIQGDFLPVDWALVSRNLMLSHVSNPSK